MSRPVQTKTKERISVHPALLEVAGTATGILRRLSIKPFTSHSRRREFMLKESVESLHACRLQVFKEKGSGEIPTIVLGGFAPDATEQVEFQRPLFREYGSIYYLNYPRHGFSAEMVFAQLADLIEEVNRKAQRPILFGVGFGCGLIARFFHECPDAPLLRVRGVVMASPVLCQEDLVRPRHDGNSGGRTPERSLGTILGPGSGDGEVLRQIERGRRWLLAVFGRGLPGGQLSGRYLSLRSRILQTVAQTPSLGAYQRLSALKRLVRPDRARPVFTGPALTLLAENEESLLVPTSPTLALLRKPDKHKLLFPYGLLRKVASRSTGDLVGHASLITHHDCYNPLIRTWYGKLNVPSLSEVA